MEESKFEPPVVTMGMYAALLGPPGVLEPVRVVDSWPGYAMAKSRAEWASRFRRSCKRRILYHSSASLDSKSNKMIAK